MDRTTILELTHAKTFHLFK